MLMVKQYYEMKNLEPRLSIFPETDHERTFLDIEQLKSEIRTVSY